MPARVRRACLLAFLLLPSVAHAERYALGVSVGESDGDGGADGVTGRGVWGRGQLSERLAVEVELARGTTETDHLTRRLGAAAVLDLSGGRFVPFVLAAIAGERAENGMGGVDDHRAVELGVGLSVEVVDRLTVGLDLRKGERTLLRSSGNLEILIYAPGLEEGEYASGRLTLGVGF
jgi:hypothetical protein